jgi:hypothetical protein
MSNFEFLSMLYPPKKAWGRQYGRVTYDPNGGFVVFTDNDLVRCEGYMHGASERLMQAVKELLP